MKLIKLNQNITDTLTNDNFRHVYKIYLEKEKKYFINLQSNNDSEFNLRIYDSNRNIIKSKYDKHDENIFTADIKNDIEYTEVIDSHSEDDNYLDELNQEYSKIYEDYKNIDDKNFDDLFKFNIYDDKFSLDNKNNFEDNLKDKYLTKSNDDDVSNSIQQIFVDAINVYEKKLLDINETLDNEITQDNTSINFNNKQYFSPVESNFFILSVSSDYENYEGEYSLLIKEVEDIENSNIERLHINQIINLSFKNKYDTKKFCINLVQSKKYELSCSSKVKILLNKDSQKIISKFNSTFFVAEFTGIYNIEVISLDKGILSKIQIIEVNPECKETNLDTIKVKNIILQDDSGNDFKLSVKDSKLIIEPN